MTQTCQHYEAESKWKILQKLAPAATKEVGYLKHMEKDSRKRHLEDIDNDVPTAKKKKIKSKSTD